MPSSQLYNLSLKKLILSCNQRNGQSKSRYYSEFWGGRKIVKNQNFIRIKLYSLWKIIKITTKFSGCPAITSCHQHSRRAADRKESQFICRPVDYSHCSPLPPAAGISTIDPWLVSLILHDRLINFNSPKYSSLFLQTSRPLYL